MTRNPDMIRQAPRLSRLGVAGLLAAALVAGCATQPGASREEVVRVRAQARWDAARAGEFEKSYAFTTPSYRAVTDLKLFRAVTSGAQALVSAKVIGVTCETEASCAARVRIEYHLPLGPQRLKSEVVANHFDEPWVKEDGEWWLFMR